MAGLRRTPIGFKGRRRIPNDVREAYGRLYGANHEATFTFRGHSEPDAKHAWAVWQAEFGSRVQALRAALRGHGRDLSQLEADSLAGEWYGWWTARHATDGLAVLNHSRGEVRDALEAAAGEPLIALHGDPWEAWTADANVKAAFRPTVADQADTAQFLFHKGIAVTNAARDRFLDSVARDLDAALSLLIRRAHGDYSSDEYEKRFPVKQAHDGGLSPIQLFEAWAEERGPKDSSYETMSGVFRAMDRHFTGRSAKSITDEEARTWINSLSGPNRAKSTVKNTWLSSSKTVFTWGVENKHVSVNPFEGWRYRAQKAVKLRERAFRNNEVETILGAARAITNTEKQINAAKRWVPWIQAYTGARPGEVTQLRGSDVVQREGIWALNLTPDAGTIKTGEARWVPLHGGLIEQGFLGFVKRSGSGPLFYRPRTEAAHANPNPRKKPKPRASVVRQRLAEWVRSLGVTDMGISPNHAWRHTFKQIAERAGISERTHDYITGHKPKTVGRGYGAPSLADMAEAMKKFPRYDITQ